MWLAYGPVSQYSGRRCRCSSGVHRGLHGDFPNGASIYLVSEAQSERAYLALHLNSSIPYLHLSQMSLPSACSARWLGVGCLWPGAPPIAMASAPVRGFCPAVLPSLILAGFVCLVFV